MVKDWALSESLSLALHHAAHVLTKVEAGQALPAALADVFHRHSLSPASRGAIQDISYRSMRRWACAHALMTLLASKPPSPPRLGVLIGCALLVKQVVTPEGCLAFAIFAWPLLRERRWGLLLATAAAYAAPCLTPTAPVPVTYATRGACHRGDDATPPGPRVSPPGRSPRPRAQSGPVERPAASAPARLAPSPPRPRVPIPPAPRWREWRWW